MGRKAYNDDLAEAQAANLPHILEIRTIEDGQFSFLYQHSNASIKDTEITVYIQETSDYPRSHGCMLCVNDEGSPLVAQAIGSYPNHPGKSIQQLLASVVRHISNATATGKRSYPFEIDDEDDAMAIDMHSDDSDIVMEEDDANEQAELEDWAGLDDFTTPGLSSSPDSRTAHHFSSSNTLFSSRARADLRDVHKACGNFKFGLLGSLAPQCKCYISISCRFIHLGISEEAMQAWSVNPLDYLILVIYFPDGYRSFDDFVEMQSHQVKQSVVMRVGSSNYYKPRSLDEVKPFFDSKNETTNGKTRSSPDQSKIKGFKDTFISKSLNEMLNQHFVSIMKHRVANHVSWPTAEILAKDCLSNARVDLKIDMTYEITTEPTPENLPSCVTDDELRQNRKQVSFPLVAYQYTLRHFVRCTEFCMVCHCRIRDAVDAIKPYVCESPLCLWQYMALGFGPSIEHEILSQPNVVDLLISFCYNSTFFQQLRACPEGMTWRAPNPAAFPGALNPSGKQPSGLQSSGVALTEYHGDLDITRSELRVQETAFLQDLKVGDWLYVRDSTVDSFNWTSHYRVQKICFSVLELSKPISIHPSTAAKNVANGQQAASKKASKRAKTSGVIEDVVVYLYDCDFTKLNESNMQKCMKILLALLPSVKEMTAFLKAHPGKDLSAWKDRIPPAAIGLLRWIIVSNRSCIMQVEEPLVSSEATGKEMKLQVKSFEERIQGMAGWMQFRFAMGSPDKEQRFLKAVQAQSSRKDHPTFFAWHGSPLHNWHGIVRTGLDYKRIVHGRAAGNGVYMAKSLCTSAVYSNPNSTAAYSNQNSTEHWPQSCLEVTSAIALNEVVNAPEKFQSNGKGVYVVQHCDWIQTRYLFVKAGSHVKLPGDTSLSTILPQHPDLMILNDGNKPTELPICALPKSRQPQSVPPKKIMSGFKPPTKKPRLTANTLTSLTGDGSNARSIEDDAESIMSVEDLALLEDPNDESEEKKFALKLALKNVTTFDHTVFNRVELLAPPSYANNGTGKHLASELRSLQKEQTVALQQNKLHELSWYVDPKQFEETGNLFQWVICLHSFPIELPFAQDMTARQIMSVILEVRFPADYPMSPPFVRIIRPRFLPFSRGGGGHITIGGSICMDLLTNSGWTPSYSVPSVLLQVRLALMNLEPRPARLDPQIPSSDYGVGEAINAYERVARDHGWKVPKNLRQLNYTDSES